MRRPYNYPTSPKPQDASLYSCCSRLSRRMVLRLRRSNSCLLEAFKLVLAVFLGFSVRTVVDVTSKYKGSECEPCTATSPDVLANQDLQTQLREPFRARTIHEVLRYDYFNASYIHNNFDDDPKIGLLGHHKADIRDIVHQSQALLNSARARTWKIDRLINGYRRLDALRGEEYVLDVDLVQSDVKDARGVPYTERHRLTLVKPFSTPQLLEDELLNGNKMIHFVIPVSGHMTKRFEQFLHTFEEVCLKTGEHVYLLIVLFATKNVAQRSQAEALKSTVDVLHQRYRRAHVRLIQTNKDFNRAMGLDLGIKQLPPETLIFFCDTDILFNQAFIDRCRQNTALGTQVYYPIVFGQYDPRIVKAYSLKDHSRNLLEINKHTGHWVHYKFSTACMYAADYRSVGGFSLDRHGWGGEDVDLYQKHVRSKLKVFRAMDPGLVHRYHERNCSSRLPEAQYRMCVDSSAETYGSKQQLAKKLAALEKLQAASGCTTKALHGYQGPT